MRFLIALLMTSVLSACVTEPPKKASGLLPLSAIAPRIKPGMSLVEVNKDLSGHQPAIQYSSADSSIWEINERDNNPENHSINANSLMIKFNNNGAVTASASAFCFLPDQEVAFGSSPYTRCYQKHLFPFNKQITYDAIKRLLIISNYQVDHSDAASELISATGTQGVKDDKDKMMFIKLSIAFSVTQENTTEVVMSATFNVSEKQETWVQAGFAGVTLPVPLPFQKKEEWIGTGIVSPKFYLDFYDALSKLIAREYLPYTPIVTHTVAPQPKAVATKIAAPITNTSDSFTSFTVTPDQNTKSPDDVILLDTSKPIDAEPSPKKTKRTDKKLPQEEDEEEEDIDDSDPFARLKGKPIDSK